MPRTFPARNSVLLDGEDHLIFVGDQKIVQEEIKEFLVGTRTGSEIERILTTVVFTDIAGATCWSVTMPWPSRKSPPSRAK